MKIKWYGHSCFKLESDDGIKIVTDPFDAKVGYDLPDTEADIVTVSHEHYDHNNVSSIKGNFKVVKDLVKQNINGINIEGIATYHDDTRGSKRGENTVYKFDIDGTTVCHLGDLGHMLDGGLIDKIKNIDVLLIPVGGIYTIDSRQAMQLVNEISPKVVIPMHYKTEKLSFELASVDNFTKSYNDVQYIGSNEVQISEDLLKENKKVMVLDYK